MLVPELRYTRNRRVLDVAARLIDFEARTGTIRELTGLTDSRIRSLSKECGVDGQSGGKTRHRGASPHSVSSILGKPRTRNEAATLLSLCRLMGLMSGQISSGADLGMNRLSRAERLCDVFWTFRYLLPQAAISFEHMLLLLSSAAKAEDMAIINCADCTALVVVDALSLYDNLCLHCRSDESLKEASSKASYRCVAEESAAYAPVPSGA